MPAVLLCQKAPRRKEWFAVHQFPDRTVPGHYLNEPRVASVSTVSLSARIVDALSIPSPFFDALWPVIFDVADHELQDTLHSTSSYFQKMWARADQRRKSDLARAQYTALITTNADSGTTSSAYPAELRLSSPPSELWYSWSAESADFGTIAKFTEFCALASGTHHTRLDTPSSTEAKNDSQTMEGAVSLHLVQGSLVYISPRRDVTFRMVRDPYDPHYGEVGNVACTGEREVALKLEEWFIENIYSCQEMFRGWTQADACPSGNAILGAF